MYRVASERDGREVPPRELIYLAVDESAGRESSIALFKYFSLPLLAAMTLGWVAGSTGSVVGLVGGITYAVWAWRRRKSAGGSILSVDNSTLTIAALRSRKTRAAFRLDELDDVYLDVKTIERVLEGNSAIPAVRFIDTKVGPAVDVARIVFVDGEGRRVELTEEFLPHMHTMEWFGKIRVFLRKHGWLPFDERDERDEHGERGEGESGESAESGPAIASEREP